MAAWRRRRGRRRREEEMVKARAGGGGKGLGGGEAVAMDVVALLNASPASPPSHKTHVLTLPSAPFPVPPFVFVCSTMSSPPVLNEFRALTPRPLAPRPMSTQSYHSTSPQCRTMHFKSPAMSAMQHGDQRSPFKFRDALSATAPVHHLSSICSNSLQPTVAHRSHSTNSPLTVFLLGRMQHGLILPGPR